MIRLSPKIDRRYDFAQGAVPVWEIHEHDCPCDVCAPYVAGSDELTGWDIVMLATLAALVTAVLLATIGA